jgi:hypothetical protein
MKTSRTLLVLVAMLTGVIFQLAVTKVPLHEFDNGDSAAREFQTLVHNHAAIEAERECLCL